MYDGDKLEWFVRAARELKQPPEQPKRRRPKVARLQSPRQRRASSQTANPIRAIYGTESLYNQTPEAPDGVELTRNVGPSDLPKNDPGIGAKSTGSVTGLGRYDRPDRRATVKRSQNAKRRTEQDWIDLANQYDI